MFDFGIICHLLRPMGIYWVGAPVRVFEKFHSLFSFLPFLFFSSFLFFSCIFCLSLSGAPLAPGPLDIVHPCHPVATPLRASSGPYYPVARIDFGVVHGTPKMWTFWTPKVDFLNLTPLTLLQKPNFWPTL